MLLKDQEMRAIESWGLCFFLVHVLGAGCGKEWDEAVNLNTLIFPASSPHSGTPSSAMWVVTWVSSWACPLWPSWSCLSSSLTWWWAASGPEGGETIQPTLSPLCKVRVGTDGGGETIAATPSPLYKVRVGTDGWDLDLPVWPRTSLLGQYS